MTDERIDARIRALDDRAVQSFGSGGAVPAAVLSRVQAARRQDRTWFGRLLRDARLIADRDAVREPFGSRRLLLVAAPLLIGAALIGVVAAGSRTSLPAPDRVDLSPLTPAATTSMSQPPTAEPTPSSPAIADDRGRFVLSTNGRIVVERGNGSDRRELTDGTVADFFPAWSPDGHKVAFFSQRCRFSLRCPDKGVDSTLVVIDVDGTGRRVLRSGLQNPSSPVWLADGSGIVETAFRAGSGGAITERVDLDGSIHSAQVGNPRTWTSPDGSEVLTPDAEGRDATSIRISNADGSSSRVLARVPRTGARLSIVGWSPDGQSIAYNVRSSRYGTDFATWLVRRDGTDAHPWSLPDGGWLDSWSADGRWILVRAKPAGAETPDHAIVARADGSNPRTIGITRDVEWTPRGSWLVAFRSGPIDSPGVAVGMVVVDPAGVLDPVEIDAPGLLGFDWRAGD